MRKKSFCFLLLALTLATLLVGCSEKTYKTFSVGTESPITPVESGTYGINVTVTPTYEDREWVLHTEFTMDSENPAVDNLMGEDYTLEYSVSGIWHSISLSADADETARGYVVSDTGISLTPEGPCALDYPTECYGTLLYEGDYRVISYITIDGEEVPYAVEFHLEGEGTTSYDGNA